MLTTVFSLLRKVTRPHMFTDNVRLSLVVACLAVDPVFAGSNEGDRFLRTIKFRSTTSFREELRPPVLCRRFTTCKETTSVKEILCRQNSAALSLRPCHSCCAADDSSGRIGGELWRKLCGAEELPPTAHKALNRLKIAARPEDRIAQTNAIKQIK
jgi:hypothetical protein